MSLDSSLKTGGGLQRHRNVLTRAERIAKLTDADKFDPKAADGKKLNKPLHLPKVGNRKLKSG
ncbi:MAG: small basic protein [Planctomycetota bacterium]